MNNDRFVMALYYAFGRKDAEGGAPAVPDPLAFAEHYAGLYDDYMAGTTSHVASVQDAWRIYRISGAS